MMVDILPCKLCNYLSYLIFDGSPFWIYKSAKRVEYEKS